MTFFHDPMFGMNDILFVVFVLLVLSVFIAGGLEFFFGMLKKQTFFILIPALMATELSLLVEYAGFSGEGNRTWNGWPHFMLIRWRSFDGTVNNIGMPFGYVLVNFLFYASIIALVFSINTLYRRKQKTA